MANERFPVKVVYLLFYRIHFNMWSKFGWFWSFFPLETGCKLNALYTFNSRLVASSFLHINYLNNRLYFVAINLFLVLLDWTSTSCAITFLVIWHILSITLACFTSNQSRYIFQLFMITPLSLVLIQRKKRFVHCFLN